MKAHSAPIASAAALNDRQRHYDLLHHRKRLADLEAKTRPSWLDRVLMRQSREYIGNPSMSCNAVDLADTVYLAQLDAFARATAIA